MILQYALDRFRRMYLEHGHALGTIVEYVLQNVVLPPGSDEHELINWYENRATELRAAAGIVGKPFEDNCTCTVDPGCPIHGMPRVPRAT